MRQPVPDVLARHPELPCLRHPAVRSAVEAGDFTVLPFWEHSDLRELLGIYEVRAQHLTRFSSEYAKQLRQSTLSFCAKLAQQPPESRVGPTTIHFDNGLCLLIWERADTRELMGCMVGCDHLKMMDSDWERL